MNCNPIARLRPLNHLSCDTILVQPRINSLHATRIWPDELFDLFLQKVLSIPWVTRIADLVQLTLELRETGLGQCDAKDEDLRRGRAAEVDPIGWGWDGIFQFWDARTQGRAWTWSG